MPVTTCCLQLNSLSEQCAARPAERRPRLAGQDVLPSRAYMQLRGLCCMSQAVQSPLTSVLFCRREYNRRVTEIVQESWINTA